MRDIRKAIQSLAGTDERMVFAPRAKVLSVQSDRTCTVRLVNTDLEIDNVRLQSVPGLSEGIYIEPAINSDVVVIWLDEKNPVVAITGKVDSMALRGDSLGGLVKAQELKTQLHKVTARIDGIIDAISNAPTTANDGGAAFKAAIIAAFAGITDIENFDNIENPNITQA